MLIADRRKQEGLFMGGRIFIVDDEEMIRSVLSQRLTREGYSCVTAHNGQFDPKILEIFVRERIYKL
jgi:DNA-binding response OmpR family regulator